jgi:predicted transcriptional regulator
MVKKIYEKKVGNIIYKIRQFEEGGRYFIYKLENDGRINKIPEVATFDNEKEVKKYLEKL